MVLQKGKESFCLLLHNPVKFLFWDWFLTETEN